VGSLLEAVNIQTTGLQPTIIYGRGWYLEVLHVLFGVMSSHIPAPRYYFSRVSLVSKAMVFPARHLRIGFVEFTIINRFYCF
jgi:hypothetical protein